MSDDEPMDESEQPVNWANFGDSPSSQPEDGGWDFTRPMDASMSADDVRADGSSSRGGTATAVRASRSTHLTTGDKVRMGVRGVGQTLITAGLVILLFVVYEVWVTNIFADQKQRQVASKFQQVLDNGGTGDPLQGKTKLQLPAGEQVILPTGVGFANLYIPAFGKDFAKTIVEGVGDAQLEEGPGHYPKTAVPGQIGNFAIAGHRVGKGEPFLNLDQLKAGDAIVVETADSWFIYTILGDDSTGDPTVKDAAGLPGREIVAPSDVGVIAPVPDNPSATPTQALITLTTCHPKYTANQRMIIHGDLTRSVPRQGDTLPTELGGSI
jgi:sortase A